MNYIHKQRLVFILIIVASIAIAVGLALYALQQNINLFYSPSQVMAGQAPADHAFRLGGMVQNGSIKHTPKSLQMSFVITDRAQNVTVFYTGVLPDLFREGQAVVVEGKLNPQKMMIADQVLAKHDERYMPPAVAAMLNKART